MEKARFWASRVFPVPLFPARIAFTPEGRNGFTHLRSLGTATVQVGGSYHFEGYYGLRGFLACDVEG